MATGSVLRWVALTIQSWPTVMVQLRGSLQVKLLRIRLNLPWCQHFLWKIVPVFFFPQLGKQGFKHVLESPPPIPITWTHTHSDLALKDWNPRLLGDGQGGGRGGVTQFCPYFCAYWKNNTGTFFNAKRVDMGNVSEFWGIWKIATKLLHRAGLNGPVQLYWPLLTISPFLVCDLVHVLE